ncbi:heparinase II/III domain-containing protein [Glutamicibacter sp. AOP38-B1-38]|uniref:heparinase II/III domain-containing protein n=1 Tax=Glutamicibacter sp. AOP38-B1-38 TaxID=3457680 RepID=UPI0040338FDC
MRKNLRRMVGIGAAGAVLVVLLFAAASFTRLWYLAGIAAIIGIALIAVGYLVTIRIAEYSASVNYRMSTRAKNLESRERDLSTRIQSCEQNGLAANTRLSKLDKQIESCAQSDIAAQVRLAKLEQTEHDNAQKLEELQEQRGRITVELARLEKSAVSSVASVAKEAAALRQMLEAQTASVDDLRSRQISTKELADRSNKDLRVLRSRVSAEFKQELIADLKQLKNSSDEYKQSSRELLRTTFESSILLGQNPATVLSQFRAKTLLDEYLEAGDVVRTRPLIENFDLLDELRLPELRKIYRGFRAAGYWELAAKVLVVVSEKSKNENDARAVDKIEHEILAYSCDIQENAVSIGGDAYDPEGPIMHMVGRVLPETQTGYTLRTQYTANAQARRGLPVVIVGQPGITERQVRDIEQYRFDDIDYYLLPGPSRKDALLDEWLLGAIEELSLLVQDVRPSILHAQSDFFNALIALAVGDRYGIPTVYESRGFWEESWLSRTITSQGWDADADKLFEMYGFPDAYTLRQRAEEIVRERADHVFTLAEVMRDHIVESSNGAIDPTQVSIVPNAVEPTNFPVQEVDLDLKSSLGIPVDTVVVGYISSIVEYEGIDTLLNAYHRAVGISESPICLLLVGDGDYLPTLKDHAAQCGIQDVFFTGRVPHSDVLRYYGLIDIFVVPRKPAAVSELVTPLKPFEAFATGRAVILSDVGALQEIARQSQAVESFIAGDSESLTQKLLLLANDPEYRADLSQRAAAWVRNHRTWDNNVSGYLDVYRQLGYEGTSSQILESELRLRQRGMNAGEIIDKLAEAEFPPLTGWFIMQETTQKAQDILANGWVFAEFAPVFVASSLVWNSYSEEHRSWGFHLHAFEFMDPFLREFYDTEDRIWLDAAVDIALGWLDAHCGQEPLGDSMAWYDMSLALRTPRLLRLLSLTTRFQDLRSSSMILIDGILRHIDELKKDEAFNAGNNHGFYTAAAQLHLARFGDAIPGSHEAGELGERRMRIMAERQFAADGVHLEHSPDYHRMLLSSFESAIHDGLIDDVEVFDRIQRAKYVLSWMIQPNGHLVQFGDTPSKLLELADVSEPHPETEFLISGGASGQAPTSELAVFNDGGYAFVRYPAPTNGIEISSASYLAFSAAFHSRAHKHADDLNFVWYDQGVEILVDSGRFGYGDLLPADSQLREQGFYYATPERQYVEGTTAHNTLMMDGLDQSRRDRKAYGSGILECTQKDNVFDLSARVSHEDYIHRRRIVFRPGQEILVLDSVFSQTEKMREAIIWFNLDGNFELISSNGKLVFKRLLGDEQMLLEITGPGELIEPVRGAESPLRGWRSRLDRQLEPVWSIGFRVPVETRASVSTRFRIIR